MGGGVSSGASEGSCDICVRVWSPSRPHPGLLPKLPAFDITPRLLVISLNCFAVLFSGHPSCSTLPLSAIVCAQLYGRLGMGGRGSFPPPSLSDIKVGRSGGNGHRARVSFGRGGFILLEMIPFFHRPSL
ncbi:hypothetical protein CEXT_312801 [Caerostris extrusa]|uniref:Uncharacterized protein n=1 Tax=Caerostris extrusa TaxID=172846 RepID=A0AAV4S8Q4_CAEEX|nr:hypothetical protein CEXT_312801 [Caerostris extrusa]